MRFACATAGVLVIATVSQARSIAPSPWNDPQSTERAEALHFLSAAQISERSTIPSPQDNLPLTNNGQSPNPPDTQDPSQHDSGSSGRVHADSESDHSTRRLGLPISPDAARDGSAMAPSENKPHTDSGPNGRVHADSDDEDARGRFALPVSPLLGAITGQPLPILGVQPPTAILLQAIQDYRGALLGQSSSGPDSPPAKPAQHMLEAFPLLRYQTRPVRQTIHELTKGPTFPGDQSAGSTRTAPKAFINLSSLSNNIATPSDTSAAKDRDLANVSSLSNNLHTITTPENPSLEASHSDSHPGYEREIVHTFNATADTFNTTAPVSDPASFNGTAPSTNSTASTS